MGLVAFEREKSVWTEAEEKASPFSWITFNWFFLLLATNAERRLFRLITFIAFSSADSKEKRKYPADDARTLDTLFINPPLELHFRVYF